MTKQNHKHYCEAPENMKYDGHGVAIDGCSNEGDELWVGNGEYASQVLFCPYCGFDAKNLKVC